MLAERLALTPQMMSLPPEGARVVSALRRWVAAGRNGACPIAAASAHLGCARAGAHLHLLIEEIAAAWPDPFAVAPPCCPRLSHDEALLAEMIQLAGRNDRPGFDRLLADLLPGDERERLFLSASVLHRALIRSG